LTVLHQLFSGRFNKDKAILLVNSTLETYTETVEIALSKDFPKNWRAMWVLQHCTLKNDLRLLPYCNKLLDRLNDNSESFQREALKALDKMQLNDEQEGKLFDICMTFWEDITKASALRYFAFKRIHKTYLKHPELLGEFSFICQEQYVTALSPGIRKGIQRTIDTINLIE